MKDLQFDYSNDDVVYLEEGRLAVIIHPGIYSNQYWCEVYYPDGIHLGVADYFSSDPNFYHPQIVKRADDMKDIVIESLRTTVTEWEKHEKELSTSKRKSRFMAVAVR